MRNWLGQDIQIGDAVYRGARDGNSSSFRLGVVTGLNEKKNTVKVDWKAEDGIYWCNDTDGRTTFTGPREPYAQTSSVNVSTVVVVDKSLLDTVESQVATCKKLQQDKVPADDFERISGIQREVSRY